MWRLIAFLLLTICLLPLAAEDISNLNQDNIDDVFDEGWSGNTTATKTGDDPDTTKKSFLEDLVKEPGFGLYASYSATGSYLPGWSKSPWDDGFRKKEFLYGSQPFGVLVSASVGLDIRISPSLRAWTSAAYEVPDMQLVLKEFFVDYTYKNKLYAQIGRYGYGWGVPYANFPYTNLLIRVANQSDLGELFLSKVKVPIKIGDIEVLAYIRGETTEPKLENFHFGGKYNYAFRYADINIGSLYYKEMPLRVFVSAKSTIPKTSTEVYAEALMSVDHETWGDLTFSASLGLIREFFSKKLRINGEFFYYGEDKSFFIEKENPFEDKTTTYPFIPGINTAFNIEYNHGRFFNLDIGLRTGIKFLYAVNDRSGAVLPGISIEPAENLQLYFAMPLALGPNPEGKYNGPIDGNGRRSGSNFDKYGRPLSFVFVISLNGSFRFRHY